MRKHNWYDDIDIDRKDSNGNYYEDDLYQPQPCYDYGPHIPPKPLTKEQVYQNQLSELEYSLNLRQEELKRFIVYKAHAEREAKGWSDLIVDKDKEINEHIGWIKDLKQRYGIKQ